MDKEPRLFIKPRGAEKSPNSQEEGRLHIKPRQPKDDVTKDEGGRLHIKPTTEVADRADDPLAVGKVLMTRDFGELRVTSAEGEPGKRTILLESKDGSLKMHKAEKRLLEGRERGTWKSKEE